MSNQSGVAVAVPVRFASRDALVPTAVPSAQPQLKMTASANGIHHQVQTAGGSISTDASEAIIVSDEQDRAHVDCVLTEQTTADSPSDLADNDSGSQRLSTSAFVQQQYDRVDQAITQYLEMACPVIWKARPFDMHGAINQFLVNCPATGVWRKPNQQNDDDDATARDGDSERLSPVPVEEEPEQDEDRGNADMAPDVGPVAGDNDDDAPAGTTGGLDDSLELPNSTLVPAVTFGATEADETEKHRLSTIVRKIRQGAMVAPPLDRPKTASARSEHVAPPVHPQRRYSVPKRRSIRRFRRMVRPRRRRCPWARRNGAASPATHRRLR
jgi:hypothetical protein